METREKKEKELLLLFYIKMF